METFPHLVYLIDQPDECAIYRSASGVISNRSGFGNRARDARTEVRYPSHDRLTSSTCCAV